MTVTQEFTLQDWLQITVQACEELATGQLGCQTFTVGPSATEAPVTDVGSYVALVGDETSAQIGVVASIDGCRALARKMLCMEPSEEISDADMCDAVGEIANILGGSVKRLISERVPGFKLGLPLFMQGRLLASDRQEVGTVAVKMGEIEAHLLVVRFKAS